MSAPEMVRHPSKIQPAGHDLNVVTEIVRKLRDSGLVHPSTNEFRLAVEPAAAKQTFRNRVWGASVYDLIHILHDKQRNTSEITLLPLGMQILDDDEQVARIARIQAFFRVPLNRAIRGRYPDGVLPDDKELERVMRDDFGVSPGQVSNARQTMFRAARQAGIFDDRRRMLVIPDDIDLSEDDAMNPEQSPEAELTEPVFDFMPSRETQMEDNAPNQVVQRPVGSGNNAHEGDPSRWAYLDSLYRDFGSERSLWTKDDLDEWFNVFAAVFRYNTRHKP